jgi:uncharacterized RDD family membrane protein YckC
MDPVDLTALVLIFLTAIFVFSLATARLAALRWAYRSRLADAASETSTQSRRSHPFAPWWRRVAAYVLDATCVAALAFPFAQLLSPLSAVDVSNVLLVFVVVPAAAAVYELLFLFLPGWRYPGQSLGKRLVGIRITRSDGETPSARRLFFRSCTLKWFLYGPPWLLVGAFLVPDDYGALYALLLTGIGFVLFAFSYLCSFWNSRKACLHDVLTDTVVIRDPLTVVPTG